MLRIYICAVIFVGIFSCTSTTTQELLDGNFLTNGQAAIDLLSPTQDQQIASANPTLTWSSRNAGAYTVQMATDSGFSSMVLNKDVNGTSYSVKNADLLNISTLTTKTYYWRVKVAKIRNNLQSKTGSFLLLAFPENGNGSAGIMYVDVNSSASLQIGSKEAPYKSIQTGISGANALRNGNRNISFDIYVARGTYNESISLAAGISIYGGYSSTDWSRDIAANNTTISAIGTTAISGSSEITTGYSASTVVNGFTINGANITATTTYTIILSGSPTISNNTINGISGSMGFTTAVFQILSANPIVSGNVINASNQAYGIANYSSNPVIINNTIIGSTGGGSNSFGIYNSASNPIIANNTISGGGSAAMASYAVSNFGSSTPTVTNNILFTIAGTSRYCYVEGDAGGDPTSFQNNLLIDCPTALYSDELGTPRTLESQLNTAAMTTQGTAASASGNLGPTSVANFAAVFFTSATDLHLTSSSPLNVRCGGKDSSLATCGASANASCGGSLKDLDNFLRTATLSGNCTGASNTGAAGYSIGAYEKD